MIHPPTTPKFLQDNLTAYNWLIYTKCPWAFIGITKKDEKGDYWIYLYSDGSKYISFKNDYLKILLFISRLQRTYSLEEAISSGIMKKPILKK